MSAAEQCPSCGAVVGGWFERIVRFVTRAKSPVICSSIRLTGPESPAVETTDYACARCRHVLRRFTSFGPFVVTVPGHSPGHPKNATEESK